MSRDRKTISQVSWDYMFPRPQLDVQEDFRLQPAGTFSRLVGIDGRYVGRLKRFPGFERHTSIPKSIGGDTVTLGGANGETLFKHFVIQKDVALTGIIRGFVFLGNDGVNDKIYAHYSIDGAAATAAILYDIGDDVNFVDIAVDHRHIYLVGETDAPASIHRLIRYDGSAWQSAAISYNEPTFTHQTLPSGTLELLKTYSFAYRLIAPEQGLYTPLSEIKTATLINNEAAFAASVDMAGVSGLNTADWGDVFTRVKVQLFRTTPSDYVTVGVRGILYLEHEHEIVMPGSDSQGVKWGQDSGGGKALNDAALVLQPSLDPEEVAVFSSGNPRAKRIEPLEGILVWGTSAEDSDDRKDTEVLRWGSTVYDRPNLIPVLNRRRPKDLSDTLLDLVESDSFLAAIYDNAIVRIHRSGSRLAIDTIHNKHGASGRYSSIALGNTLYIVSPVGLLICDLPSGQVDVVGATQHFFDETSRWGSDLANLRAGYDAKTGALCFLNPTKSEMLIIWMNHGVLSQMIGMPWTEMAEGVDIFNGGHRRTFFVTEPTTGVTLAQIYEIDHDRSVGSYSTCGGAANLTYNPVVGSGSTDTIIVFTPAITIAGEMYGHFLRFITGNLAGEQRRILSMTTTSCTLETAFSEAPAAGDRCSIAPIPFQATFWPLSDDPDRPGVLNLFRGKSATAMGAVLANLAGDVTSTNPNHKMNFQLYDRGDAVGKEVEGSMLASAPDGLNDGTFVSIPYNDPILIPGVECFSSNVDFDLLAVLVDGKIDKSKSDVRPA